MSSSTFFIYAFTPLESAKMAAMPIMPMLPAKAVIIVRPFLLIKLLKLSDSAVKNFMEARLIFFEDTRAKSAALGL